MQESFLAKQFQRFPRRVATITAGAVLVVCIILLLSVSVNRTVDTAGKILPAREWILAKNAEGAVFATFRDHLHSIVDNYTVVSIVRGDAFRFSLHANIRPDESVRAGDTVVRISSHELARQLSRLRGDLSVARSNLAIVVTGEKRPITEEAERALVLAKEQSDLQTGLFERQDSLYRKNLISRELYELAGNAAKVSSIEVAIAEARLQTVLTGAKPEQIRMIRSQIAAFESDLRVLSDQVGALTVLAPFGGIIAPFSGKDTLCSIEDAGRVALMPVPVQYLERLAPGQAITLRSPHQAYTIGGTVVRVDRHVRIVNARQVFMVTAALSSGAATLPTNLILPGSIETERVSIARYLQYWFSDILTEIIGGPARI
jgi:hypothetical protein